MVGVEDFKAMERRDWEEVSFYTTGKVLRDLKKEAESKGIHWKKLLRKKI